MAGELIERERELAALEEVLRDLPGGGGGLVFVGGEAGIGKTSLLRELRARAGGAPFVGGACEPLSVPVPLAPVRELADAAGDPLPAAFAGDRLDLALRLLAALRRMAPVVAVVEDAHWADPATLDVVRLLARRVEGTGIAFVLTYRDDEVRANPALEQLVGDLATSPLVRRIGLRVLSAGAVRRLAAGSGADPERLARVTGGNPFLVMEALAAGGGVPATVRDATLARAGRLGPDARAVVDAAAVAGQRIAPVLLEAVVPGSAAGVEEALARGVMVVEDGALGFRHELIREAIEEAVPPPRRAQLHARVVTALDAAGEPDHARLAHHAELAGLEEDGARFAALAADEAERVGALRETALQSARALRLGRALPPAERFELLLQHARSSNFGSTRLEDAVESAEAAEALAADMGAAGRRGRALLVLASALWSADRVVEAQAAAAEAAATLDGTDDLPHCARAHAMRVRVEATTFDPGRALELAPAALAAAEVADLEEVRIDVAISTGLARGHLGEDAALAGLAEAARAARTAGLPFQTVRSLVNLVFIAGALRRHADVDRLVAEAHPLFHSHQTAIPANAVESYRARSLLDRGRWDEALAIAAVPGRSWAGEAPMIAVLRGTIAARRGRPGADALGRGWAELERLPETSRHAAVRVALVEAAWLRGDRAEAVRHLAAAGEAGAAARFARPAADLAVWAARLGVEPDPPANLPAPAQAELGGDWRGAVRGWAALDAPYEAALAALPGDDAAARDALAGLRRLGAAASAEAFARERAARGRAALRGSRRSTAAHPAGLTRREQAVLERLAAGATNRAIAAALHISERTAAHHVSAVLRKLGTPTRHGAVDRARERGLLPQDGQAGAQT